MNIDIDKFSLDDRMTGELWHKVTYFTLTEDWGNYLMVKVRLIYLLDALRQMIGAPIIIHNAYSTTGHVDFSQHYYGNAVDLHAVDYDLKQLFLNALKLPFTGIGYYKFWYNPGLHLDVRPLKYGEPRKLWIRNKNGIYESLVNFNQL